MARVIGIHHLWKKEKEDGDEGYETVRGTLIAIKDLTTGQTKEFKLGSESDELDFLLGRFVTSWREAREDEDLSLFFSRHIHECPRTGRWQLCPGRKRQEKERQ